MESQDSQIDSLHQKASAHYLQGEFHQALEAWKELLALDPQDERAIEGVKLCELLAEEDTSPPAPAAGLAEAPATPAAAPAGGSVEGFDDDLDELDAILDGKAAEPTAEAPAEGFDFDFSDPEQQAVDQPTKQPADGPDQQAEGIDLGGGSDAEPLALDTSGEPQEIQFGFDPQSIDLPSGGGEGEPADPADPAAAELRHRVQELMGEAQSCLEKDDMNGALSALNRIAILDEHNEEAQALRKRIEEGEAPAEPAAESAEPPAFDLQIPDDPVPAIDEPPLPVEEPVPAAAAEPEPAPEPMQSEEVAETPFDDEEQLPAAEAEAEPSVEIAVGMPKPFLRDRFSGMNLLIAGGVLAAIAIGGASAWWFVWGPGAGGEGDGSGDAAVAEAGTGPLPALPELPGEEEPADSPKGAKNKAQKKSPEEIIDVTVLMAEAEAAFDREDYGEAVLAYSKVLEADPDNQLADTQLAIAGERYREQKEIEEKRAEAIEAFNVGNYRAALTLFYRMPESEDQRKLDRYKLNGWYNMGLQALSTGDCSSASTHLKEAKAIDGSDKGVIIALDLARICKYSRGDSAYIEEVGQLTYRSLED
jgi:tetratricopeptide (TPR) repeat protein